MIPGFYSSAAGMMSQLERQDVIANNLANINTAGFKKTAVSFSAFNSYLNRAQPDAPSCMIPFTISHTDNRQGTIQDTGSATNLALEGPGYFMVQTEAGEMPVRNGSFMLDSDGQLVTHEGHPVLGEHGPIRVSGTDWTVDTEGNVRSDGTTVDKLRIEQPGAGESPVPTQIVFRSLEGSNVNAVEEMVSMISAMRAYEACQRTITSLDQTLDKAINQMGRMA